MRQYDVFRKGCRSMGFAIERSSCELTSFSAFFIQSNAILFLCFFPYIIKQIFFSLFFFLNSGGKIKLFSRWIALNWLNIICDHQNIMSIVMWYTAYDVCVAMHGEQMNRARERKHFMTKLKTKNNNNVKQMKKQSSFMWEWWFVCLLWKERERERAIEINERKQRITNKAI